jgi:DNA polymerase-3 subunit alpha/error-prone DNA polymerase
MVQMQNELKHLEIIIGDHPLRLLREEARRLGCITTQEAAAMAGRRIKVAGILAATRKVRTSQGRTMQFITLEDEEGLLEGTLFPRDYQAYSARILTLGPYIAQGKVEVDHGAVNLSVSRVEKWPE